MAKYLKALLASLVVGLLFTYAFNEWRKATQPKSVQGVAIIDQMEANGVPGLSGVDIKGKVFSLDSMKGQIKIVNFWASWCGPCVEEFPSMIKLVKAMGGQVKLVAISGDDSEAEMKIFLKSFPDTEDPNITIIWDKESKMSQTYNVDRLPESFIVGKDGKLVKKVVGSIDWGSADSQGYFKELIGK